MHDPPDRDFFPNETDLSQDLRPPMVYTDLSQLEHGPSTTHTDIVSMHVIGSTTTLYSMRGAM